MRESLRRSAHGAVAGAALVMTFLVPPPAAAQGGRLENCRFGESCWGGTMDKSNERIQQQMRDARSGNGRSVSVEAPRKDAPGPTKPLETIEMDMRLFSFGDCEKRFGNGSPKYQECTRVVASDEARQAKLDRACHESYPTDPAEYERCRLPKRLGSDSVGAAAAAAVQGASAAGAQAGAGGSNAALPVLTMPVGASAGAAPVASAMPAQAAGTSP